MGLFKPNKRIFFDLDGTLLNSKNRLYCLFQNLIPQSNLSSDEYWNLKRNQVSNEEIINEYFPEIEYRKFHNDWMSLIETYEYLDMDLPFEGVSRYLLSLKDNGLFTFLVTARQSKEGVFYQFKKFGWMGIFNAVLVTENRTKKEDLIRSLISEDDENWIVGDTGKDILVAKKLKVKSAAVLSGFLSEQALSSYHPDLIFEKVTDFNPLIW